MLPRIIGSIISWLPNELSKTAIWLASNLWVLIIAIIGLLIYAARDWIMKHIKHIATKYSGKKTKEQVHLLLAHTTDPN